MRGLGKCEVRQSVGMADATGQVEETYNLETYVQPGISPLLLLPGLFL